MSTKYGDKPNGQKDCITKYSKTRLEAKQKLEDIITKYNTKKLVKKSNVIFKDITKEFIDMGYDFNKLSDSSYLRKLGTYNQICGHYLADMEVQRITERDVKSFLIYITKYSNSVIGKIYGLVNNTFKIAIRRRLITDNFLDNKIEFGKPISNHRDKKVRGFTIEEQKLFIDVALHNPIKYKYQFLLSMFTGMRMGEINALDKDKDIDFVNKIIHVRRTLTRNKEDKTIMGDYTKTKNGVRDIVMDDQVEFILKEYLATDFIQNDHNLLFYNPKYTYYSTSQLNMVFKRVCEKYNIIGYNVNQHQLRHTFATRCIEAGMPANVLSKIMGHADIRTTLEVYCDVFANYEKQHANRTYEYLKQNDLLLTK